MTTNDTTQHDQAVAELRQLLKPGDTVRTVLDHVSASGMTRAIRPVIIRDNEIHDLTYLVGKLDNFKRSKRHEGIEMGGCGMDMGFALVYNLSRTLWPDGFDCVGDGTRAGSPDCPANDHSNTPSTVEIHHRDGGYALVHRWL